MFIIRNVETKDLDDLYNLSKLQNFINLPNDKDLLKEIIKESLSSFKTPSKDLYKNTYMFVIEDRDKKKVIGSSLIHAQHGTPESPHFYLKEDIEKRYSKTIKKEFVHKTLKLGFDINGPTEIGGLVMDPSYRGHKEKLGKQISFVRFFFMALNDKDFKETIHSELLPPFDQNGSSALWEALGRKFFNMNYHEADKLSRSNSEFILNLFPRETIYLKLLPENAVNVIGQVNSGTVPVQKMLTKIGFKYNNNIDPFDGGPHYQSKLKEILPVKETFKASNLLFKNDNELRPYMAEIVVSKNSPESFFQAKMVYGKRNKDQMILEKSNQEANNFTMNFMPLFY